MKSVNSYPERSIGEAPETDAIPQNERTKVQRKLDNGIETRWWVKASSDLEARAIGGVKAKAFESMPM
ncbi:MAG: hypothetical protein C5B47_02470 [Verrucomicrobia bacterium]|nr:MAG: hypothetical protein C5B47_02470 [Verrucomicrobiota bacterium]